MTDIAWLIATGAPDEEIKRILEREQFEKDITDHYERVMRYSPLNWNNPKLKRLKTFLLTKSKEDITTFATWCKREFSSMRPEKLSQYPELVIVNWLQAFPEDKTEEDGRHFVRGEYAEFIEH
jgi:hypothetical protein